MSRQIRRAGGFAAAIAWGSRETGCRATDLTEAFQPLAEGASGRQSLKRCVQGPGGSGYRSDLLLVLEHRGVTNSHKQTFGT